MQINWFTVIAQVVNFLLLVWLLKKFLYKPVLKAIDEREKKIVARLEDAEAKKAAAKKEQDDFAQKNEAFDKQKKELMDSAMAETNLQKDAMMEEARKTMDTLQRKQQKAMLDKQENFEKELSKKAHQEVFNISRKVLNDLASVSLEDQMTTLFVDRIQQLKGEAKQQFMDAFQSVDTPVLIQSAFELNAHQQQRIKESVNEMLEKETTFQFKTAPEIISGIELTANGYKMEWSVSAWLNDFQSSVSNAVENEQEMDTKKE
jgi:F-type H+-transporting ATPase subunit b